MATTDPFSAQIVELVRKMPDDVTTADVMDELYARMKIEEGLKQLDNGEGIPHDEAKARLARWLA